MTEVSNQRPEVRGQNIPRLLDPVFIGERVRDSEVGLPGVPEIAAAYQRFEQTVGRALQDWYEAELARGPDHRAISGALINAAAEASIRVLIADPAVCPDSRVHQLHSCANYYHGCLRLLFRLINRDERIRQERPVS